MPCAEISAPLRPAPPPLKPPRPCAAHPQHKSPFRSSHSEGWKFPLPVPPNRWPLVCTSHPAQEAAGRQWDGRGQEAGLPGCAWGWLCRPGLQLAPPGALLPALGCCFPASFAGSSCPASLRAPAAPGSLSGLCSTSPLPSKVPPPRSSARAWCPGSHTHLPAHISTHRPTGILRLPCLQSSPNLSPQPSPPWPCPLPPQELWPQSHVSAAPRPHRSCRPHPPHFLCLST